MSLFPKVLWPFSFERSATFPPQADHVLVDLFSSMVARGASQAEPRHFWHPNRDLKIRDLLQPEATAIVTDGTPKRTEISDFIPAETGA